MNVFLIGFMGSGKSTTGKRLAKQLGYEFVDTDKMIVERFGMSVNKIFNQLGEKRFRESETELLKELINRDKLVVSTGGGLPCNGDNMDLINQSGCSIYFKVSPAKLYKRLSSRKHKRPLIKDLSDKELKSFIERTLSEREVFYNRAKHVAKGLKPDLKELVKMVRD